MLEGVGKALADIEKHAENRGIRGTVSILKDLGLSHQAILGKIQKQYNLDPETSKKYLQDL